MTGLAEGAAVAAPAGSPAAWAWLMAVVPLASAAVLLVVGRRLGRAAPWVAILSAGFSLTLAVWTAVWLGAREAGERTVVHTVATWLPAGDLEVDWAVLVDPLAVAMSLLVTGVGLLIHVYSLGYMEHDRDIPRFFAYLNLFLGSMLVLVLGESLLTLFVGWELVGLCSYLLIGFWFDSRANASAAKKAFVINRVGDVGFMIAMFVLFGAIGSLSLTEVLPAAEGLAGGTLIAVGLLLFLGATGKSAQIPLYIWLPDAMAGPTPVSALIHAATMVTAGVYLVARMSPLYVQIPEIGLVVAAVGAATALVAALIAVAQNDIKRVLAYSTVSQLGYMFMAVGVGAYSAGIFHLLTHGFFKALLFLAAGSVMHAMADRGDIREMGGLLRDLPITGGTAAVGTLAIAGFPLTAGFYSKEEILAAVADTAGGEVILAIGLAVALLTAFYMARWFALVFLGPRRFEELEDPPHPHESPLSMTLPLVLLAVASLGGGLLNLDPETGLLAGWLAPSVVAFEQTAAIIGHGLLEAIAIALALVGLAAGVLLYRGGPRVVSEAAAPVVRFAQDAFRVDELYRAAIVTPGHWLAVGFAWFDARGIDGLVNGAGRGTATLATAGARVQTGFVRSYALAVLIGTVLLIAALVGVWMAAADDLMLLGGWR